MENTRNTSAEDAWADRQWDRLLGVPDTGNYSCPRECQEPGCEFSTLSRREFWIHATETHSA